MAEGGEVEAPPPSSWPALRPIVFFLFCLARSDEYEVVGRAGLWSWIKKHDTLAVVAGRRWFVSICTARKLGLAQPYDLALRRLARCARCWAHTGVSSCSTLPASKRWSVAAVSAVAAGPFSCQCRCRAVDGPVDPGRRRSGAAGEEEEEQEEEEEEEEENEEDEDEDEDETEVVVTTIEMPGEELRGPFGGGAAAAGSALALVARFWFGPPSSDHPSIMMPQTKTDLDLSKVTYKYCIIVHSNSGYLLR